MFQNDKNFKLSFIKKGHKVLYLYNDGRMITYSLGFLYELSKEGVTLRKIGKLPLNPLLYFLCSLRAFERLIRAQPRVAIMIDNEKTLLISFMNSIYNLDVFTGELYKEFTLPKGMSNVLYFTKVTGVQGFEDSLMFGEYSANKTLSEVRIFRRSLTKTGDWKVFTSFPEKSVLHIHNILVAKDSGHLIVLTGDSDSQSGVWRLTPEGDLTPLLVGSQQYRSCFGFISLNVLTYLTDTPLDDNNFYNYDLSSGTISNLNEILGPVIYGSPFMDGIIFSTSVESDSRLPTFKYLLSRKPSNYKSCVVYYYSKGELSIVTEIEKDFWPMALFQFGTVQFVSSPDLKSVVLHGTALKGYDNYIFSIN